MINISKNKDLKEYNTFNLSCKAEQFVEFDKPEYIQKYLESEHHKNSKHFVLGGGSNVLFSDKYDGTIFYSSIKGISIITNSDDCVLVKIGSGVVWDDFVKFAVTNNFYGTENLSLIPGNIGASAVQNIGAYGVEAKDLIQKIEYIEIESAKLKEIENSDCNYAYRDSIFKHELQNKVIITNVYYKLSKLTKFKLDYGNLIDVLADKEHTLLNVRNAVIETRQTKLPDTEKYGNAGSFFKNPIVDKSIFVRIQNQYPNMPHFALADDKVKIPTGWLIDTAGWKDKGNERVGVYKNQALVIINKGNATSNDIVEFYKSIQKDIFTKFGITIEPEVIFVD